MKIFGLITVQLTNAAVVRRQASFNRIFNGDYSVFNDIDNEDLSTTEDFDDIDDILRLGTTPQPFDIFQTTGPIIDEIRLWTTGPDYPETTEVPFGGFTTEEIGFGDFSTGAPEIDLSTVMTFPTDAPTLFTTGSIFDFTTIPDLVTLGVTAPVTGLPPIPETTEFVPFEPTTPPMIIGFTTPFQFTPTVPEWLFQTTNSLDFPEFSTEDFTGIPFSTTPQPTQPTQPIEKPNKSPDAFDKDAFANAIENAVKAIEDNQSSEADNNNNNPAIIDDNSVAVLIPVPNKSTTSSPVITSTSASTTTFSSTSATSTTASTTSSSTTSSSTTTIVTTKISTKSTSTTTTSTSTIATSSSSMSPSETTVVVASLPDTTAADEDIITNSLTTETDVSSVIVDVTTPADHVVDLTTGDIDVTETPEVSNVTAQATTATPSVTTAEAGSGFSVTGLALTALFIILL